MNVLQKLRFQKSYKKLHKNQRKDVDKAIRKIMLDPSIGTSKSGDLSGIFIYKFKMDNDLTLITYTYEGDIITLILIAFNSPKNSHYNSKN